MAAVSARFYVLDAQGAVVEAAGVVEWAQWFERASVDRSRIVQQDYVEGSDEVVGVSTVFLGLNQRLFGDGPPELWETMVFGTPLDGVQDRYTSREAARRGHARILARVSAAWRAAQE